MTLQMQPDEIDKQLQDGTLDLDFGQTGVQQAAQAKILLDPALKANADANFDGAIRYVTAGKDRRSARQRAAFEPAAVPSAFAAAKRE